MQHHTDKSSSITKSAAKIPLIAALALPGVLHALQINVTGMDFYPPGSTSPAHTNTTVSGSIDFTAGTGTFTSGSTPFFGVPWTATVAQTWEAPGTYTFSGTVPAGNTSPAAGTPYSYSFTLGADQYAAGLMFQWGVNRNIPVLAVFDCVASTTTLAPLNSDGDVSPGTAMQTAPFPGQTAAFTGALTSGVCPGLPVSQPSVVNDLGATLSAGPVNPGGDGTVTLSEVISAGIPTDGQLEQQCVGSCFDFTVSGLGGPTAEVVLPLSSAIPAAAVYRKWNGSSWVDFDTSGDNAIASAAQLSPGVCPTSGYSEGLNQGHTCVRLTIVDGGPNDLDGQVNGTVVDPGGVGEASIPAASTSLGGGCSLGSTIVSQRLDWLLVGAALAALGGLRRRIN